MVPLQFGKYQLVERLGLGGMAEVWKARVVGPQGFARTVVVKRVLPHLVQDPAFVKMFFAEARLSARLTHANVVQVFELGEVGGEYFLAMEYVRGKDLTAVSGTRVGKGPLPIGFAVNVIREVCRALDYTHGLTDEEGRPLRLVHRDVSPSNVMIGFDGGVKLLDFGIAKALADANEHRTVTGTLKGKFGYMSPEQVDGHLADHRADLFAAGIILHELLTNKRLFKGASDIQTLAMVREAKVAPPSEINPEVLRDLDQICMKALARDPAQRYQTCGELAIALDDIVHRTKWGPERLGALMLETFNAEPTETGQVPRVAASELNGEQTVAYESAQATIVSSTASIEDLRPRSSVPRMLTAAAAIAILGGGIWIAARATAHGGPTPPAVSTTAPAVSTTAQPGLPAPAAMTATVAALQPSEVTVTVGSVPPGAEVFIDQERATRGRTPLTIHLPRVDRMVQIRLSLDGYARVSTEISAHSDAQVQLALIKEPAPRRTATAAHTKKPTPDAPKRHVAKPVGDLADPFAP
ncbi:MAG: serine/threonine protein kinase [Polyangia bacterium]